MVQFLKQLTREEAIEIEYDPKFAKSAVFRNFSKNVEFYQVRIDSDDLENNLHIYYNDKIGPHQKRYGWALFESEFTKLSKYAKKMYEDDFIWEPSSNQLESNSDYDLKMHLAFSKNLGWMKCSLENYNPDLAMNKNWMIIGNSKEAPFMIMDGVHRALLTYMHYFLKEKKEFHAYEKVICAVSPETNKPYFRNISKLQ